MMREFTDKIKNYHYKQRNVDDVVCTKFVYYSKQHKARRDTHKNTLNTKCGVDPSISFR